ncbi:MAG: phoR [Paenibacillaceae bacterium]|jgi:PAS domain S-box-containing protein|nr:phoR [Paenibacillaceae bacterium]
MTRYRLVPLLVLLLLGIGSLVSGLFPLRLMFGVEYFLAGLFGFAAYALFGPFAGVAVVVVGLLPSLWYWGHPYGMILMVLENILICFLIKKYRSGYTTTSLIFWVIAGIPLTLLFYGLILHVPGTSLQFVVFKMGLNGLGNAAAASLVIPVIALICKKFPYSVLSRRGFYDLAPFSLAGQLSNIMVFIILIMAMVQMGIHSRLLIANEEDTIAEKLVYAAEQMNLYTDTPGSFPVQEAFVMLDKRMPELRFRLVDRGLKPGASMEDQYGPLPAYLTGNADNSHVRAVTQRVNLWSPSLEESGSRISQRMNSVYYVDMQWNGDQRFQIFVELPAQATWSGIYGELAQELTTAFTILALAVLIIYPICRFMNRPIVQLAALSGRLSASIGTGFRPTWPDSTLVEIQALTNAFKLMSMDLNQQFASILEATREAMVLCDKNGTILYANSQLDAFFGERPIGLHSMKELFGAMRRFPRDDASQLQQEIDSILRHVGEHGSMQRNFTFHHNQHKMHLSLYVTIIQGAEDAGERNRLFIFRDRTEEMERELLQEEMIAQVSHEFRTPLTPILGYSEILRSKELSPEKLKSYSATIHHEAVRLSRLVDDFLDLQRMESGRQPYYLVPMDVRELVTRTVEEWRHDSNHHPIHLKLPDEPVTTLADADRMRQVLDNLISNAVKYSPDGSAVQISAGLEGGAIRIDIADNGLGIPDKDKEKIFRKFYRVENNDRKKIPGSGLGLPIAKEIVEGHSGQITFVSRHYGGSIFTVWLPVYTPPATEGAVLLIGKEDGYTESLATVLAQRGEHVLHLGSFEEALFAIGCGNIHMPRIIAANLVGTGLMNGLEFASRLRSLECPRKAVMVFLEKMASPSSSTPAAGPNLEMVQAIKPFSIREMVQFLQPGAARGIASAGMREPDWCYCFFPVQEEKVLRIQLAKFGLIPEILAEMNDMLLAGFAPKGNNHP